MNFDFSEDQKALRDTARRLLSDRCSLAHVRAVHYEETTQSIGKLWQVFAQQGWLSATIPESYGGLGLGSLEQCVLAEELGRALAPVPFGSTLYLFVEAILLAGDEKQKADLLPKVSSGELIGAFAASEGPGVLRPASLKTVVIDGRISGVKVPVTDGVIADICVVLATQENGALGLFLVDLRESGVRREKINTLDPSRDCARVTFTNVSANRLGGEGKGVELMNRLFERAAVYMSFEQLGGALRCLEMAVEYASSRFAFGRPIGSFQAIKHKLVDVYLKIEIARSSALFGAWALNTQAVELPLAASAARIAACEAYWYAAKENIQVHGGIGYTWEADCHLFYRRSQQLSLALGSPRVWKERLVSHLESVHAS
jgi:alkylation response protein AidB-like acyl-CoA dehydrogenase